MTREYAISNCPRGAMAEPEKSTAVITVLIIDDDPSLVKATSRLLRSMGFDVLIATGGREAVEICRAGAKEISVVLLDLMLSGEFSTETLRQLRSFRPAIKVILTSGHDKQESVSRFAGLRLDGFLRKPFGYAELESTIRAVLSHAPRTTDKR